ncbi:MAG: YigZ family protein [Crocinitomicaceae bacterium]
MQSPSESLLKEKGSKFLGHVIPVKSTEDAKAHIQNLRDLHPKACHVCFGWRIGTTSLEERSSDDGEPSNSAGKPIFGQIVKYELVNVLVAVVRYYGGVNLGVGGLISAYKGAAEAAIKNGSIIEKHKETELKIYFAAEDTGEAMMHLNRANASILNHSVDQKGHFVQCSTLLSLKEDLLSTLNQTNKFDIEIIT